MFGEAGVTLARGGGRRCSRRGSATVLASGCGVRDC
jgi:hypothetical protein